MGDNVFTMSFQLVVWGLAMIPFATLIGTIFSVEARANLKEDKFLKLYLFMTIPYIILNLGYNYFDPLMSSWLADLMQAFLCFMIFLKR